VAVADAFDAMTSARSYRMALSQQYALAELRKNSGAQFHPDVVDAFEKALRKTG
jgi:HD-GYP domain-containing protein (c-di-GMP phosphodiesterase class II)